MKSLNPYFAYGSNLNFDDWRRNRPDLPDPATVLEFVCEAYLPDSEVVFNVRSNSRRGGVLNIKQRTGQLVPGVIFRVKPGAWDVLDRKEGAPGKYERIETVALSLEGQQHGVTTYRVPDERCAGFVSPQNSYLEAVCEALGEKGYGLGDRMVRAAARNQEPTIYVDALFVYGTLMRGECRHGCLDGRANLECALLARAPGRLVDLGEYPGMLLPSGDRERWVEGEFFRVREAGKTLTRLDEIEGFNGYGTSNSLFSRRLVEVDVGDGRIRRAWTYVYGSGEHNGPPVQGNDWRASRGRRQSFLSALAREHHGRDEAAIAERLAKRLPWSMNPNQRDVVRSLLPLAAALERGELSERRLAQESGKWVVVPG
jgi:gamma-glutamylcyclotransferase (GGCT)/AIG2-like uncharacterized protein YtfP